MRQQKATDPGLGTLFDERDHLSVQISLLKDSDVVDPMELFEMQRRMDILDRRIATRKPPTDA